MNNPNAKNLVFDHRMVNWLRQYMSEYTLDRLALTWKLFLAGRSKVRKISWRFILWKSNRRIEIYSPVTLRMKFKYTWYLRQIRTQFLWNPFPWNFVIPWQGNCTKTLFPFQWKSKIPPPYFHVTSVELLQNFYRMSTEWIHTGKWNTFPSIELVFITLLGVEKSLQHFRQLRLIFLRLHFCGFSMEIELNFLSTSVWFSYDFHWKSIQVFPK